MAATLVRNSGARSTSSTSNAYTWPVAPVVGNKIIVICSNYPAPTVTVTDNATPPNTYTKRTDIAVAGDSRGTIFEAEVVNVPTTTTVNSSVSSDQSCVFTEWSGLVTGTAFDQQSTASNSSAGGLTSFSSGTTPTLTQADELVIGLLAGTTGSGASGITTPSGYTQLGVEQNSATYIGMQASYKVVSAASGVSASWSFNTLATGAAMTASVATFKIDTGGGASIAGAGQIASGEAFGSAAVGAAVAPAGIASAQAFGAAAIGAGITTTGIATSEAVGAPAVGAGIAPAGIATAQALGQPSVAAVISTTGIASAEAFGLPVVAPTGIVASGIPSAEAFGQPAIAARINTAGVASAEAFGQPLVGAAPPASVRTMGFEIGARNVSFKPLLQRVLKEKYPRVKPAKERAQKRAKAIEVQGAEITLNGSATESKLRELAAMWLAERPVMPPMLMQADPTAVYLAQIAFRIRQQQDEQQLTQAIAAKRRKDDEEAALLLLLA